MKKIALLILFIIVLLFTLSRTKTTPQPLGVSNESLSSSSSLTPSLAAPLAPESDELKGEIFSDFDAQLDLDLKSLPTMDDLQNLTPEEVHHTPEIMKNGGERIGRIHDQAENDPGKRVGAMIFFKTCAEDQEIATAIRAVCLSKIYKLIPLWKIPVPLSQEDISDEVSDLALKLP